MGLFNKDKTKQILLKKSINNLKKEKEKLHNKIFLKILNKKIKDKEINIVKGTYFLPSNLVNKPILKKIPLINKLFSEEEKPTDSYVFFKDESNNLKIFNPTKEEIDYFEMFKNEVYIKNNHTNEESLFFNNKKIYFIDSGIPSTLKFDKKNNNMIFDTKSLYQLINKVSTYRISINPDENDGLLGLNKLNPKILILLALIGYVIYRTVTGG